MSPVQSPAQKHPPHPAPPNTNPTRSRRLTASQTQPASNPTPDLTTCASRNGKRKAPVSSSTRSALLSTSPVAPPAPPHPGQDTPGTQPLSTSAYVPTPPPPPPPRWPASAAQWQLLLTQLWGAFRTHIRSHVALLLRTLQLPISFREKGQNPKESLWCSPPPDPSP